MGPRFPFRFSWLYVMFILLSFFFLVPVRYNGLFTPFGLIIENPVSCFAITGSILSQLLFLWFPFRKDLPPRPPPSIDFGITNLTAIQPGFSPSPPSFQPSTFPVCRLFFVLSVESTGGVFRNHRIVSPCLKPALALLLLTS